MIKPRLYRDEGVWVCTTRLGSRRYKTGKTPEIAMYRWLRVYPARGYEAKQVKQTLLRYLMGVRQRNEREAGYPSTFK